MPAPPPLTPLDLNFQIPRHFRCPISLELIRDPVTLSTGQTYDRSSIEKWVASGNTTCPVTMQKLKDFTFIPNHTLRRLIQEWCVSNRSKGVQRIPTPKQPAEPQKVRCLLAEASISGCENCPERLFAIRALRNIAADSDKNRQLLVEMEAVPVLIGAIFGDVEGTEQHHLNSKEDAGAIGSANAFVGRDISEEALGTLVLLFLNDRDRLNIMHPHRLVFMSSILQWGSIESRVSAGALVEMLSDSNELSEVRVVLATTDGIVQGLVNLLTEPAYPKALKVGIKALFSVCLCEQGKERAVAAGACLSLIERLVDVDKNDAERALGTIELLCTTEAGCAAVSGHAIAAAVLVKVILKVSDRATEYAAGALLAICNSSQKAQRNAVQAGVLKELLLLIQSGCSDLAKAKAMNILKLLRSSWLSDSYMTEYGRTDVVPY
eukprot:c20954_g1_i2 orf=418-1725(+)